MARRETIEFVCDVSGKPADEQVDFALDGQKYQIDLTDKHAKEFRALLTPFIKVARNTGSVPNKFGGSPDLAALKEWAAKNQIKLPARGRIPHEIRERFEKETKGKDTAKPTDKSGSKKAA